MWKSFQVYIHVHTVETGYQRRYHQGNGKACHAFHDSIHVVGNDGSESIHCPCKDVAVDVYRVVRLFQFDNNILQQFQIKIVRVLEDVFNRPIMTSLPRMEVLKYTSVFAVSSAGEGLRCGCSFPVPFRRWPHRY